MQAPLAVLAGLASFLLLVRAKVPMGLAFVAGAAVLGLAAGLGPGESAGRLGRLLLAGDTWTFAVLVGLVFILSSVLRLGGSLDVLVQAAGHLIRSRRTRMASLPALVGLLPMPGGAVVSAPLVDRTGCDFQLGAGEKNLINYWFRHIWEVCWPLYPPLLLAADFLGGPIWLLCAFQAPLCLLLVVGGYLFILRRVPGGRDGFRSANPGGRRLLRALLPLLVVIATMPLFTTLVGVLFPSRRTGEPGLGLALATGILLAARLGGGAPVVAAAFRERTTWALPLLAVGVKVFGGMVADSGAAQRTAELFQQEGIPPTVAVALLPFFVGMAAGNTIATVSVAFPVIIALLGGPETPWRSLLPFLVLAYAAGFVGYMLSPVHMCMVLSSRYFGEALHRVYGRLAPPLLLFATGAAALFVFLRSLAL